MKKGMLTMICLAGALLLAAPAAEAAVFNVSTVPQFQAALTEAQGNGVDDTINVAAGTYNVTSTLEYAHGAPGGNLFIVGAGADTTILDGGGAVQVMHIAAGTQNASLSGITIRNGMDTFIAGGLNGQSSGTFTISDSVITGNTAPDAAGMSLQTEHLVISNTTISNNTAANVAGGADIFQATDGTVMISNSTISGNSAMNEAGLKIMAGTITITGSTISDNTMVSGNGMAGLFADASVGLTMTGNTITGNTVTGPCPPGGTDFAVGLQVYASGPLTFTRNLVDSNTTPCAAFAVGIDLYHFLSTDTVTVADNIFSRNTSGPGTLTSPINILSDDGTLNVVNNTFAGNVSGQPGLNGVLLGVTNDGAALNASNNIFSSGSFELDNNGDGVGGRSPATLRNNIFDPGSAIIGADTSQSGNLNVDPLFADGPNGDFHISDGSPAVDAGLDTAPGIQLLDFDGDLRVDGPAVDIGADEFFPPPTFDPVNARLVIDEVQLVSNGNLRFDNAGAKAYAVVLNRLDQAGYVFELDLASVRKTTASSNPGGTFNTKSGLLEIPVVDVGLARTYNAQLQKRATGFIFDLVKAKKN